MTVAAVTRHLEDVCYQPSDRESKDISGNYVTGDKLNKLACTRDKCEQNAQKRNEDQNGSQAKLRFVVHDARSAGICLAGSRITSVLFERPFKSADQKTERGKVLNPEYSINRDHPTSRASPLRINTLLYSVV